MFELMEQAVFVAGCCICIASLIMRKKHYVLRHHENPHVQGFGRLNPHVVIAVWGSEQEARTLVMQTKCSSNVVDLNGKWNFRLFKNTDDAFLYRDSGWREEKFELKTVVVPGSWQLQFAGDTAIFTNGGYVFPLSQIDTPCDNPTGYYAKEFALKSSWSNRRIILNFAGVDSAFYVWVNGKFVGFSKDSRLPTDFDITPTVQFNKADNTSTTGRGAVVNTLQVLVCRMSDGLIFENQDMWNLSGIFRDVMIVSYPLPLHIYDFSWNVEVEFFTSCYAATHIAYVNTSVQVLWDMEFIHSLLRLSGEGSENFDITSNRSSPYFSQLQKDWVLATSVFEEGCLLSSNATAFSNIFTFEYSGGDEAIATCVDYVPIPNSSEDEQRSEHEYAFADDSSELPTDNARKSGQNFSKDGNSRSRSNSFSYIGTGAQHRRTSASHSQKRLKKYGRYVPVTVRQRLQINNPRPWRPEKPNIYTLVMSIRNSTTGEVLQSESCHFGLRTVDILDGTLCINKQPVLIRGVNYHEFSPIGGHTCSTDLQEADIKLMKRNNINALRTAHYPQSSWLYELCNVYGLYVIDEANIETHGMGPTIGRLANDSAWYDTYMQRLKRMVERDKGHVCIIGWSLGNDSGYGEIHDRMADWVRTRDPSRIVLYEPASYGPRESHVVTKDVATDVLFPMYTTIDDCVKFANMHPNLPLILSAYGHMMGNSGGNLIDYWTAFHNYPRLQGGFLYDWADQGISVLDSADRPMWAYTGDFGEAAGSSVHRVGKRVSRVGAFHHGLSGLNFPDRGLGPMHYNGNDGMFRTLSSVSLLLKSTASLNTSRSSRSPSAASISSHTPSVHSDPDVRMRSMSVNRAVQGLQSSHTKEREKHMDINRTVPIVGEIKYADTMFNVDTAKSKPGLLEAKQCMKRFSCLLNGTKINCSGFRAILQAAASNARGARILEPPTPNTAGHALLSDYQKYASPHSPAPTAGKFSGFQKPPPIHVSSTGRSGPSTSTTPSSKTAADSYDTGVCAIKTSVGVNILSDTTSNGDIVSDLTFVGLLLCDGLVVSCSPVKVQAVEYTDATGKIAYMEASNTGRCTVQQLNCKVDFNIPVMICDKTKLDLGAKDDIVDTAALYSELLPKNRCCSFLTSRVPSTDVLPPESRGGSCSVDGGENMRSKQRPLLPKKRVLTLQQQPVVAFGLPWEPELLLDEPTLERLVTSFDSGDAVRAGYWTRLSAGLPQKRETIIADDKWKAKYRIENLETESVYNHVFGTDETAQMVVNNRYYYPSSEWSLVIMSRLAERAPYADAGFPMGFSVISLNNESINMAIQEQLSAYAPSQTVSVSGTPTHTPVPRNVRSPEASASVSAEAPVGPMVPPPYMQEFLQSSGIDGIAAPLFDYGSLASAVPASPSAGAGTVVPLARVEPRSTVRKSLSVTTRPAGVVKYKKTYVLWDTNEEDSCRQRHYNEDGSVNQSDPPNVLLRAVSYEKLAVTEAGGNTKSLDSKVGVDSKEKMSGVTITSCIEAILSSDTGMLVSYKIDGIDVFPEELNRQHLKYSCSMTKPSESACTSDGGTDAAGATGGFEVECDGDAAITMDGSQSDGSTCGSDLLLNAAPPEPNALDCRITPARIHMHRAYLDNDRMGYASRWEACGLHGDMLYRSNLSDADRAARAASNSSASQQFKSRPVPAKVNQFLSPDDMFVLENISLHYISESSEGASSLSGATVSGDLDVCCGVEVSFETKPVEVDDAKIQIIRRLQMFSDDPMAHQMFIVAKNTKEEVFIHQLASSLRFGRESVVIQNAKQGGISAPYSTGKPLVGNRIRSESGGGGGIKRTRPPMGITVKLWKPQLKKCSTIPRAEALAIGPFGVPAAEEIPYEEDFFKQTTAWLGHDRSGEGRNDHGSASGNKMDAMDMDESASRRSALAPHAVSNGAGSGDRPRPRPNSNGRVPRANIVIKWNIKYLMSPSGELKIRVALDASKLPVVMPRIGLQLNILNDLQYVLYKGNGPHECYPDRKASSIHALHHAHVDDMYTPYVHPTESSGRTDVHWCSFTQTDTNNISSTENNRVGTSSSSSSRRDATSVFMDTTDGDAAPVKKTIGLLVYSGYITGNRDVTNVLSNNSTTVAASASSTSLPRNHYTTKASINSDYDSIVKAARDSDSREQVKLFNFSAQRHTTEDLALATHSSELELFPRQFVAVNVDPFMMGVGGDDGWSASVHEEHLLNPGVYTFDINLSIYYA